MPRYVKTVSFKTSKGVFRSDKDDPELNTMLDHLRGRGAEILDVDVHLAATAGSCTLVYVVHYESPGSI